MTVINNMRVKPLEWVERRNDCYSAAEYDVRYNHNSGGMYRIVFCGRVILKRIRGLEKAKAWVAVHNIARIMAALEPAGGE